MSTEDSAHAFDQPPSAEAEVSTTAPLSVWVIVPCRNEVKSIESFLHSLALLSQTQDGTEAAHSKQRYGWPSGSLLFSTVAVDNNQTGLSFACRYAK